MKIYFKNIKKRSVHISQGKKQLKFERNPCMRFSDNCDTDDAWTTTDYGQIFFLDDLFWHSQTEVKCFLMIHLKIKISKGVLKFLFPAELVPCPSDFTFLPTIGSCYHVVRDPLEWRDSEAVCNSLGGYLVELDSIEEAEALRQILDSKSRTAWDRYWSISHGQLGTDTGQ